MSDRDELATELLAHVLANPATESLGIPESVWARSCLSYADNLLGSRWLREHDRQVRREVAGEIAQAIEAMPSCGVASRGHEGCYVADSLRIAREVGGTDE